MVEGFEYVPYNDVEALKAKVKEINGGSLWDRIRGKKRGVAAIMMEALQGEGGIQVPGLNLDLQFQLKHQPQA